MEHHANACPRSASPIDQTVAWSMGVQQVKGLAVHAQPGEVLGALQERLLGAAPVAGDGADV